MLTKDSVQNSTATQTSENRFLNVKITAKVKWFDIAKGYGFVVPEEAAQAKVLKDIMLHVSVLRRANFFQITQGAKIVCFVELGATGWHCSKIFSVELPEAYAKLAQMPLTVRDALLPQNKDFIVAEVKWFTWAKGFGFLSTGAETKDIFIHIETLRQFGFTELHAEQKVFIKVGDTSRGLTALEIYPYTPLPATH